MLIIIYTKYLPWGIGVIDNVVNVLIGLSGSKEKEEYNKRLQDVNVRSETLGIQTHVEEHEEESTKCSEEGVQISEVLCERCDLYRNGDLEICPNCMDEDD